MHLHDAADAIFTQSLCCVDPTCRAGEGGSLGRMCVLERDVVIGEDCQIGDYVKLCPGTTIGDRVVIDDYVNSSGAVVLGNDIHVKRMTCLTQGTIIEDQAFIGPGVMIIHEKDVSFARDTPKVSHGVYIRQGAVIGGGALLNAGVTIDYNAVVAAGAVVTKDCMENGIYMGVPAELAAIVPPEKRVELERAPPLRFSDGIWKRYLPHLTRVGRWERL
jgi:acetyltransferase-like isoleucine patch superfamily enzyme